MSHPDRPARIAFKDLEVWKKAVELADLTHRITRTFRIKDSDLREQMNASAESISSNIAEAEGRATNKDSLRIYYIARGSLWGLCSQLEICSVRQLISPEDLARAKTLASAVGRLVSGVIRLRRKREELRQTQKAKPPTDS